MSDWEVSTDDTNPAVVLALLASHYLERGSDFDRECLEQALEQFYAARPHLRGFKGSHSVKA